ncbi:MAG: hypothetical protein M3Z24_12595, partial [Chloroflexota bacterium]|nr:hypothetical protein [Chloroflexota bacterium]
TAPAPTIHGWFPSMFLGRIQLPLVVYLFSFSLLSFYCFNAFVAEHGTVANFPGLVWVNLSGLWIWGIPLLALLRRPHWRIFSNMKSEVSQQSDYVGEREMAVTDSVGGAG